MQATFASAAVRRQRGVPEVVDPLARRRRLVPGDQRFCTCRIRANAATGDPGRYIGDVVQSAFLEAERNFAAGATNRHVQDPKARGLIW